MKNIAVVGSCLVVSTFLACGDDKHAADVGAEVDAVDAADTVDVGDAADDAADADTGPAAAFVSDQRIVYTDGLHNENTSMLQVGNRILLVFRGGETGQVGSAKAHLNVYVSTDDGAHFDKRAEVNANKLPDGRDIRDPKLVLFKGHLYLYAISRLPGGHYRDLFGQAWTVRAESTDLGETWSDPVNTDEADPTWSFWRFTQRDYHVGSESRQTLYATAYNDGDTAVSLFVSEDGVSWTLRSTIYNSYDEVPSETELEFFGPEQDTAVAIVRLDDQEILQDGQSAICTSKAPFETWECGRRIEERIDGPTWIRETVGGVERNFLFARKHLPCTAKRSAFYELRGDLTDPTAAIEVCEIQEVKSSGDTAYTAAVRTSDDHYLVSWYSSTTEREVPWLEGQFTPADIWLANVDLTAAPETCTPLPPKLGCAVPPLPENGQVFATTGTFLLALAPVIWPAQQLLFQTTFSARAGKIQLTMQGLDAKTHAPVGDVWTLSDIPLAADGKFTATFDEEKVAAEVFPLLNDPFLSVHDLTLSGQTTSLESFCGVVTGYAQILGDNPADRITLDGSTFGAVRFDVGDALPTPVAACE